MEANLLVGRDLRRQLIDAIYVRTYVRKRADGLRRNANENATSTHLLYNSSSFLNVFCVGPTAVVSTRP